MKNFCYAKSTMEGMKRQATDWEKISEIIYLTKTHI